MEIVIDGYILKDKNLLFQALKQQINSDEFHGNNLDALFDVLSHTTIKTNVLIKNHEELNNHLGNYATALITVFEDLVSSNEHISLVIESI